MVRTTTRRLRIGLLTAALAASVAIAVSIPEDKPCIKGGVVIVDEIPHIEYCGDRGVRANPWIVARWAVSEPQNLRPGSDWLISNQHRDGSWRYDFDHVASSQVPLAAGWASGLSQGGGIRALAQAYEELGDEKYIQAARAAVDFLDVTVEDGGVRTTLDGSLWFEEYPTDPPSYVLNGFLFLLEGLWDARSVVPEAGPLYDDGRETIETHLGRWDDDGRAVYDLFHESLDIEPWWNAYYDGIHKRLLETLLEHRESSEIREWHDRWFGAD